MNDMREQRTFAHFTISVKSCAETRDVRVEMTVLLQIAREFAARINNYILLRTFFFVMTHVKHQRNLRNASRSSRLIATTPAPPTVVPWWVDPSVYTWMSVGTVSSMAASVAAKCWSLDIDFESSVIAVGAGGGRLQGGSGLGGE